jgi:uncharacterized protein YcnI
MRATVTYLKGAGRIPDDVISEKDIPLPGIQRLEEAYNYAKAVMPVGKEIPEGTTQINFVVWDEPSIRPNLR